MVARERMAKRRKLDAVLKCEARQDWPVARAAGAS
jgi:hypothetical protein